MRPRNRPLAQALGRGIARYEESAEDLPGIATDVGRDALLEQLIESVRRASLLRVVRDRPVSGSRTDPDETLFDPLRAATIMVDRGERDEAFWLVFLAVHFGNHHRHGWAYARAVYAGSGRTRRWTWGRVSEDPGEFTKWVTSNGPRIRPLGAFGNHRKFESLRADSTRPPGAVVDSYVRWVDPPRSHDELMDEVHAQNGNDPAKTFGALYKSLRSVLSFGRLARFDYLMNLARLELCDIVPGSAYLDEATGPLRGARLLFGGARRAEELDEKLIELDGHLNVGLDVLEDALCNWGKSPDQFVPFRGLRPPPGH